MPLVTSAAFDHVMLPGNCSIQVPLAAITLSSLNDAETLFDRDADFLDDLGPRRHFLLDESTEFLWRIADRVRAQPHDALLDFGYRERLDDSLIEAGHHGSRRAGRNHHAVPFDGFVAGYPGLGNARDIGQRRIAFQGGH